MQGIYKIINIKNNKVYIGSSENIDQRIKQHIRELKNNKHHSYKLQIDWNKFGEDNFISELLEEINNIELLRERELYWIKFFNSINEGYNLTDNTSINKKDKNVKLIELKKNFKQIKYKNIIISIQNRDYWKKDIKRLNREINLYTILPIFCNVIEYYFYPKIKDLIIEDKLIVRVDIETFYSDFDIQFLIKYTEKDRNWRNSIFISIGEILKLSKQNKEDYEKTIVKCLKSGKYRCDW